MMTNILDENNLRLDFTACNPIKPVERFDIHTDNPYGMSAVDFFVETVDCLYFVEVKDYQHPKATPERRKKDYEKLVAAIRAKDKAVLTMELGQKIKDSLLRKYSLGESITKNAVYLLLLNSDELQSREREKLQDKISGHIPTGLNDSRFCAFTKITFALVNPEQIKAYGITCTAKS